MNDKAKYVAIIAITALADQLTKAWVLENLRGKPPIIWWQDAETAQVWFELQFTTNTGAAWGMFAGNTGYLALLSAIMIIVMGWVLMQARTNERLLSVALSLMLGGAFGNLLDRVLHEQVTDFLHAYLPIGGFVHWVAETLNLASLRIWEMQQLRNGVYDFPIFNVADSAVVVGTLLLLIALMRAAPETEEERAPADSSSHALTEADTDTETEHMEVDEPVAASELSLSSSLPTHD